MWHRLASCLNYVIIFQCNNHYQKKDKIRKRNEKSPKHLQWVKDRTFEYLSENYLIKFGKLDKNQRNCDVCQINKTVKHWYDPKRK